MKIVKKLSALILSSLVAITMLPFTALAEGTPAVERIEVSDISVIEGTSCSNASSGDTAYCWYHYEPQYTVYFKDGTSQHSNGNSINIDGEFYNLQFTDDQSYQNQWGVGSHTVTASFMGIKSTFIVNITESPVERITVSDISIIEGTNGYTSGMNDTAYYRYSFNPQYTVYFKDGTSKQSNGSSINIDGKFYNLQFTNDQSYENQWGIGSHTINANFMGVKSSFIVNITENPVERITVSDISIIEGTNGYTSDMNDTAYYRYSFNPQYTVYFKDGTSKQSNGSSINIDGKFYSLQFTDDQSYQNQWGVGSHTVTASFMGIKSTFIVNITESPVERITISDISIIEGTNGYTSGMNDTAYYRYSYHPKYTVYFKDGTSKQSNGSGITIDGEYYSPQITDNQSYQNQWGVGSHTVTASFMGIKSTFIVNITESPVERITVSDISVIEGTNGHTNGTNDTAYYHYFYNPQYIVYFKDGTSQQSDDGSISISGKFYNLQFTDDQNYENQWGVGSHTATASFMGVKSTFKVNITETPVQNIELIKLPSKTAYITGEMLDMRGAVIRFTYKDGSHEDISLDSSVQDILNGGRGYYKVNGLNTDCLLRIDKTQLSNIGTQKVTLNIHNFTLSFNVIVTEYTMQSISIRKGENKTLIITLHNQDGSSRDLTVLDIPYHNSNSTDSEYEYYTITDNGTYLFTYVFMRDDEFYISMNNNGTQFVSNTLTNCDWMAVHNNAYNALQAIAYSSNSTKHFDGTITAENIDNIIIISILSGLPYNENSIYDSDTDMYTYKASYIRNAVFNGFGIENIDLSLSKKFNVENDTYTTGMPSSGSGINSPTKLKYDNGIWNVTAELFEGNMIYIKLDEECKIISYDFDAFIEYKPDGAIIATIPDGTETIKSGQFSGNNTLTAITIPRSVKAIANDAFDGCSRLSMIYGDIYSAAYYYALEHGIPFSAVGCVPYGNFDGGSWDYDEQTATLTVRGNTLPDGSSAYSGSPWYYYNDKAVNLVIENGVTSIGKWTFSKMTSLENITIPESVKKIGENAFRDCRRLKTVSLPQLVTEILPGTFYNCSSLENINLSGVMSIGDNAFYRCVNLKSLSLEKTVYIGNFAFSKCTGIISVMCSELLSYIGEEAFGGCTNLKQINLPTGNCYVDINAFLGCSSLDITTITPGDLDANGKLNAFDLSLLRKYLMGQTNGLNKIAADVNEDDVCDIRDLVRLKKILVA